MTTFLLMEHIHDCALPSISVTDVSAPDILFLSCRYMIRSMMSSSIFPLMVVAFHLQSVSRLTYSFQVLMTDSMMVFSPYK